MQFWLSEPAMFGLFRPYIAYPFNKIPAKHNAIADLLSRFKIDQHTLNLLKQYVPMLPGFVHVLKLLI